MMSLLIRKLFNKGIPDFPKRVERVWLCGQWVDWKYSSGACLMPYFDYAHPEVPGCYVVHHVGEITPYAFKGSYIAYYRIVSIKKNRYGSDRAGYDDGLDYTLNLVKVEKKEIAEFRKILERVTPKKEKRNERA